MKEHGHRNSDGMRGEMKRWREGHCNPMKKAIMFGALVWFLVMGGFLALFKKTVKVMSKKEYFAQLKPIEIFQEAIQPAKKSVVQSKVQLLMPNNYIAPRLPFIETQQVPLGEPAQVEVPQQTYTLSQVQALLEMERSRIARQ